MYLVTVSSPRIPFYQGRQKSSTPFGFFAKMHGMDYNGENETERNFGVADEKAQLTGEVLRMKVEQYVMAYGAEQDRLRALLPEGFVSLRPVLRINAEIRDDKRGYLEYNTPVEKDGNRGWLNIGFWEDVPFEKEGKKTTFCTEKLVISYTGVGVEGSCPAEKDNDGCYFGEAFHPAEKITANKEYCDCQFRWFVENGASGESTGVTLPAFPEEEKNVYPKEAFTVENAAKIPCTQVLGAYVVEFERCL